MERGEQRKKTLETTVTVKAADGLDAGPGSLEGYASVFGNVDSDGEIMLKGAFAKTIAERVAAGKVPLMAKHRLYGGDTYEVIGTVKEAREDDRGLWIRAEFSTDDYAQSMRQKAAGGHVRGLSVAFQVIDWTTMELANKTSALAFKEVRLIEITLTAFPANEEAQVTQVKSLDAVLDRVSKLEALVKQKATLGAGAVTSPHGTDADDATTQDADMDVELAKRKLELEEVTA